MPDKKTSKAPASDTLLVELLTEELPPKSLRTLSEAFGAGLLADLTKGKFLATGAPTRIFATPRRLAIMMHGVLAKAPDVFTEASGPAVGANPEAVKGFAGKHGVAVESLEKRQTPKGEVYVARFTTKGAVLDDVLSQKIEAALKALPIPKTMRWGDGNAQFARPVHGLVMMHGSRIVPGEVLGQKSANRTLGHRFLSGKPLTIRRADDYERVLRDQGKVIASFEARKKEIARQIQQQEDKFEVNVLLDVKRTKFSSGVSLRDNLSCNWELSVAKEDLLDEVVALVEYPMIYVGHFGNEFLELPMECLTLSMRQHQRYFPCFGRDSNLASMFLFVSNSGGSDPKQVVRGNERVLRARLADARFFYDLDRKTRLEARVPRPASVVYHNKLGSQLERIERIQLLAGKIARDIGADPLLAERAAWLSKADLLTEMVGEFPELQGTMGRYYALHDGEPKAVADAIESHYRPRFAGDALPEGKVAFAVTLADKLDALAGLFGIGQVPTGDRDPFGLRRAALGVIRILVERNLALSLKELVDAAFAGYGRKIGDGGAELESFVFERYAGYLREMGFTTLQVDSVLSKRPFQLSVVPRQLEAVKAFQALPEAESLAAANKRVANILRQAASKGESYGNADKSALKEPAEVSLFEALESTSGSANKLYERGDYAGYLKTFAVLKAPVDAFFDKVMVMAEQEAVRRNRLALLNDLREAMNRFADISKLAA